MAYVKDGSLSPITFKAISDKVLSRVGDFPPPLSIAKMSVLQILHNACKFVKHSNQH
jgi:hypothetical protein